MNPDTEALIAKANRNLALARRLVEAGDQDVGVARAYYAMFYLATAMLAAREKSFSKHSAVIAAFAREFVASGEMSADHHVALRRGFELRNLADYATESSISVGDARAALERAARFVNDAEAYLRRPTA